MEHPHRPRPTRLGFTLIELLIAILIIATLLALLVPTVAAAFRKAKESQVAAEMNNLATAIASFKVAFNANPPSRLILPEQGFASYFANVATGQGMSGADSSDTDMTDTQLAQRSLDILRGFWPRVNFMNPPASGGSVGFFDFNNNGKNDGAITINGSECLTFFLGGIPLHGTDGSGASITTGVSGFSKLPTNPFLNNNISTNRTTPNYEFVTGRLVDLDHDGIPSYLDPIDVTQGNRRAYVYFSAYGVNGYDPNDVNGYDHNASLAVDYEFEDDGSTVVERGFQVSFPVYTPKTTTQAPYAFSPAPNPYTAGVPTTGGLAWINPNSYQILCAGADRQWGLGGTYVSGGSGNSLPILPGGTGPGFDPGTLHNDDKSGVRLRENDNLANFSTGRLN